MALACRLQQGATMPDVRTLRAREDALRARAAAMYAGLEVDELEDACARAREAVAAHPQWAGLGRNELRALDRELQAARDRRDAAVRRWAEARAAVST